MTVGLPSAPGDLSADWDEDNLTLSWSPPADDGRAEISAYEYRYKLGGPTSGEWIELELATSVAFDAAEGVKVNFEVRAINAAGAGPAASLSTPGAPSKPLNVDLSIENGTISLSWDRPAFNGGSSISGFEYRIAASGAERGGWSAVQTERTATLSSIDAARDYIAEVRAVNAVDRGEAALVSTRTISAVVLVDVVRNSDLFTLSDGAGLVRTVYDAGKFTIRADVLPGVSVGSMKFELSGRRYRAHTDNGEPFTLAGEHGSAQLYGYILPIGEYRLAVTAYAGPDRSGDVLESLEFTLGVAAELPQAPRDLSANWDAGTLHLTWSKPANAGAAREISGYEYRTTPTGQPFGEEWTSVGNSLSADVANATDGTSVEVEMRARNPGGTGPAASLSLPTLPSAPRDLAASVEDGQLELSWEPPSANGGQSPSGYQFRYGPIGGEPGAWSAARTDLSATVPDIDPDLDYAVEVLALNAAGAGEADLEWTAVIQRVMTRNWSSEYDIVEIEHGSDYSYWRHPQEDVTLHVETYPETNVGSMSMDLRLKKNVGTDRPYHWREEMYRVRNAPPWYLFDWGNDPDGWKEPRFDLGGTYSFIVVAHEGPNLTGKVLQTLDMEFTRSRGIPIPNAPTNLAVSCNDADNVVLSWEDSEFLWLMIQFGSYEYRYQSGAGGVSPNTAWTNTLDELSAEIDIPCDQTYSFEVRATGSGGDSDPVPYILMAAPGPVDEVIATGHGQQLSVKWQPPIGPGSGPPISGYQYRYAAAGLEGGEFSELQEDRAAEITDFDQTKPVVIEVRAVNELGNGAVASAQANSIGQLRLVGAVGDAYSDLLTLTEGDTVTLAEHAARLFTIRADTLSGGQAVGSVSFELRGAREYAYTDNTAPYTLYGGIYASRPSVRTLPAGNYLLTLTAYSQDDLAGKHLGSLNVSFRVVAQEPQSQPSSDCPDDSCSGAPVIVGAARVGEVLAVDTSSISSEDGSEAPTFTYQWLRNDGSTDFVIDDARLAAYQLTSADQGQTIKVRVSVSDSDGNEQTLTSEATAVVEPPADQPTEVPVWSADMLVVDYETGAIGAASSDLFSNVGGSSGLLAKWLWFYTPDRKLHLALSGVLLDAGDMTLRFGDVSIPFPPGSSGSGFTWSDVDLDWEDGETLAVRIVRTAALDLGGGDQQQSVAADNNQATGAPTITGTAQVGETLLADTSGISDEDGLTNVVFSYQWLRNGAEIGGAIEVTYVLVEADEGETIGVRVSFTDDAEHEETLVSTETAEVAAEPGPPPEPELPDPGPLAGFSLVAGGTGNALTELDDGAVVVTGDYSTTSFAIRANLVPGESVGSIKLKLVRGSVTEERTEGYAPYSLYGDGGQQDLTGKPLAAGDYELTATAYSERSGGGDELGTLTVSFTVVMSLPTLGDTTKDTQPVLANRRATGLPTIDGPARVGETLTAEVSGIADDDGLDAVTFSYRWLADEAEIQGATGSSYTLTSAEQGQAIRVTVSFTDDANNEESLTSEPTGPVVPDPGPLTVFTIVDTSSNPDTVLGTLEDGIALTLDNPASQIYGIRVDTDSNDDIHKVELALSGAKTKGKEEWQSPYSLYGDEGEENLTGEDLPAGSYDLKATAYKKDGEVLGTLKVSFTVTAGQPAQQPTVVPNTSATGVPTISGTVQVGQTLTADTSGIADADGLTNAVFSYQWVRSEGGEDTNIQDATGSSYTLVSDDKGKAITVTVSFTDAEGNPETLTSDPTGEVAAKPNIQATGLPTISGTVRVGETLTADVTEIADEDGLTNVVFSYQWVRSEGGEDTNIQDATDLTYTLAEDDEGKTIKVRVSFTDDANNEESLPSAATDAVAAAPAQNIQATGLPSISGTLQVGETLTADTTGIADADGLTTVSYSYQWLADDTNIQGATEATYTLAEDDEGKAIKVLVSFTDDAGHEETRTSAATAAVEPAPNNEATGAPAITGTAHVGETLMADTSEIADEDGLTNVVFSYQWMADDTNIQGATDPAYTLTEDDEGKAIKVTVSFTDDANNEESLPSAATNAVAAAPTQNNLATGAPTISGTAQVGQTLTADTSGIADEDGLDNVTFSYQWLADDSNIQGATDRTYTLADRDEGKAITVIVSFTDDANNEESLPSAATDAVVALPGKPQSLAGEATAQEIKLTWTAPTGDAVVEYVVYRGTLQNGSMNGQALSKYTTIEATDADMTYTDDNVEEGVEYRYRVTAVNSDGEGKKSNWLDITAEEPSP